MRRKNGGLAGGACCVLIIAIGGAWPVWLSPLATRVALLAQQRLCKYRHIDIENLPVMIGGWLTCGWSAQNSTSYHSLATCLPPLKTKDKLSFSVGHLSSLMAKVTPLLFHSGNGAVLCSRRFPDFRADQWSGSEKSFTTSRTQLLRRSKVAID